MYHDWWYRRMYEKRAAERELWDEFERTRPLSDPEPADEETEITLERPRSEPVSAEH